jgi:deoxyribonuclease-4
MLIGAHVSPAGGLPKAVERGLERNCRAIQIFNQSPRMWRPTVYPPRDVEAFREAMTSSQIDAVLIHAVYLLNCASEDREIRHRRLRSRAASRFGQDWRPCRGGGASGRDDS